MPGLMGDWIDDANGGPGMGTSGLLAGDWLSNGGEAVEEQKVGSDQRVCVLAALLGRLQVGL